MRLEGRGYLVYLNPLSNGCPLTKHYGRQNGYLFGNLFWNKYFLSFRELDLKYEGESIDQILVKNLFIFNFFMIL